MIVFAELLTERVELFLPITIESLWMDVLPRPTTTLSADGTAINFPMTELSFAQFVYSCVRELHSVEEYINASRACRE